MILTLKQLIRLRERWEKAMVKDGDRRIRAIAAIDAEIAGRKSKAFRCALPKKKQRELGIIPKLGATKV